MGDKSKPVESRLSALRMFGVLLMCGLTTTAVKAEFIVAEKSISRLQVELSQGTVTSEQLVAAYLERIKLLDNHAPALRSILHINPKAQIEARNLDRERSLEGPRSRLHGIPIVVKDSFNVRAMTTSGASNALKGSLPEQDAAVVQRLKNAGAIILAKANMHELSLGITTVSSEGGRSLNPYDRTRNPGGSSGGSAIAATMSFAAAAMAADTCGSIRIPAANNNLFGIRPSSGLWEQGGILPLSSTLDSIGPVARTVEDLAIMLDGLTGGCMSDDEVIASGCVSSETFVDNLKDFTLLGKKFGVLEDFFDEANAPKEHRVFIEWIAELKQSGTEIVKISKKELSSDKLWDIVAPIIIHEFKRDLNSYLRQTPRATKRNLFEIIQSGNFIPSIGDTMRKSQTDSNPYGAEHVRQLRAAASLRTKLDSLMATQRIDAVIYPTITHQPTKIGQAQKGNNCALSSLTGLPAISVPAGFTSEGLPVAMEMLAGVKQESLLLGTAFVYESTFPKRRPPEAD